MSIKILKDTISIADAKDIGREFYDDLVKGAVDTEREVLALGGEFHMDANNILIQNGSEQKDIWGFNLVWSGGGYEIEYKALINIRPAQGNRGMEIANPQLRNQMSLIIRRLVL
jgi:hypothetical protein